MKKIIYAILLLPFMLCAQSGEQNYVKTKSYKEAALEPIASPTAAQVKTDLVYFDGLGRPIQKNAHLQSSTGHDIITHMTYDALGRQAKEYLPFSSQQQNMAFDSDSENNTLNYPAYSGEANPYSQKFYDFSPLNKVLKQALPGNDWIGNENDDNDHAVKFVYDTNLEQEKVWNFYVSSGQLKSDGYCKTGALDKTIIKNENWISGTMNTTEEFKDHLGLTVLKRAYEFNNETSDTYYVYDTSGNLAFAIPPLASPDIATVNESQIPYSYTQSINISELMLNYTGGGGGMIITIENNMLKLACNAGFNSTQIDVSKTFLINASRPVPDMTIGTLNAGFGRYTVYIQNNQLKFIDNYPNSGNYTSLNHTLTVPLDSSQFGTLTVYTTVVNQSIIPYLCYQYKYDSRFRLVEKKLPGKDWEFIAYDKLDRVVATGPALNPFGDGSKGWLFTKYDAFNRPVYNGWYNGYGATSADRTTIQTILNGTGALSESRTASNTINNIPVAYTNAAFPSSAIMLLGISYYDDYGFPGVAPVPTAVFGEPILGNVKGLSTGSWTRVLTTASQYLGEQSTVFYDTKARPVRSYLKNYLGGYTQSDSRIDFSGKTLYTVTEHKRTANVTPTTIREDFTYTDQERLLTHTHQINNNPAELLAKNEYDELGQLVLKSVGRTEDDPLQKVDYTYNIRGWLLGINDITDLKPATDNDLFAYKVGYNEIDEVAGYRGKRLYNGNISETYWKTRSDVNVRKYAYKYDGLNRLEEAQYQRPLPSTPHPDCYGESLSYDKNGNIQTLTRYGNREETDYAQPIDALEYTYHPDKKNQLMQVYDSTLEPVGFSDGNNGNNTDYAYDDFGNMTGDMNKGIDLISYNHLNLPVKIAFSNGAKIEYLYRADGTKVQKKVFFLAPSLAGGLGSSAMDYLGGFQYQDNVLKHFPTAEGYVSHVSGSYQYVYNYTDHLGNIRLSYGWDTAEAKLKIMEENHYYPFGMKHANYNTHTLSAMKMEEGNEMTLKAVAAPSTPKPVMGYNYKYNGKEYQDELGLNEYAFGFRDYDPAIGRWNVIDPLAEKYITTSPYAFVQNNPLINREIDGRYFDKKNDKQAKKIEKAAEKQANKLEKQANKLIKDGKSAGDLMDRVAELRNSAQDVRDMRSNTSTEFKYGKLGSKQSKSLGLQGPTTTQTGTNAKGDNVVTMFVEKNMGNQIHETRHGGDVARGNLSFNNTGGYGVSHEITAYKAQYSYDGTMNFIDQTKNPTQADILKSLQNGTNPLQNSINSINSINSNFVNNLVDPGFAPIYPPASIPLTIWNAN